MRADRSFGTTRGWFQGTGWLAGRALSTVNNSTGITYGDGSLFFGRVPYPPQPTKSACVMTFRSSDSNNIESSNGQTERSQLQWSEGTDGVTLAALPKMDKVHWIFGRFCFDVTNPWPTSESLFLQFHETKNTTNSWGGSSPVFAIYIQNVSGQTRMVLKHLGLPASARGSTSWSGKYNINDAYTLVSNVQPNTEYEILIKYLRSDGNDGYLQVWVNNSLVVNITGKPTAYPQQVGIEINADGSYRTGYGPFITLSFYQYRSQTSSFTRRTYWTVFGYCPDGPGRGKDEFRAAMDLIGAY